MVRWIAKGHSLLRFCVFALLPALLFTPVTPLASESVSFIAFVIDVSGSMRQHGFERAKAELMTSLRSLPNGTRFCIIPFAENDRAAFSGELTPATRDVVLRGAGAFVADLEAGGRRGDDYGYYTNLDEGIEAGMVWLLEQPEPGKRSIVVVSDGISDPDAYHEPVDIRELGARLPDSIWLYLIDLTGQGGHLPSSWKTSVGAVNGFQAPGSTALFIPCRAGELTQTVGALPVTAPTASVAPAASSPSPAPSQPETVEEKPAPFWYQRWFWLVSLSIGGLMGLILLSVRAAHCIRTKRDQTAAYEREKARVFSRHRIDPPIEPFLTLTVAGTNRSKTFRAVGPMTLQFGTDPGLDFQIPQTNYARINGELRIDEAEPIRVTNLGSTFPFEVDGQKIGNGESVDLPDKAAIRVARGVVLEVLKEMKRTAPHENRADRFRRYAQKKLEV